MKLDPNKDYYEQEWGWVAHPDALNGGPYGGRSSGEAEQFLVDNRYNLNIIGGIADNEASYSYDDWVLVELNGQYWMLSTSGCSCPSPRETWRIEKGPASLADIRKHVIDGDYEGYTMPKKQLSDFVELLDKAELEKV